MVRWAAALKEFNELIRKSVVASVGKRIVIGQRSGRQKCSFKAINLSFQTRQVPSKVLVFFHLSLLSVCLNHGKYPY